MMASTTSSLPSLLSFAYKATIALNNMAVTMMERSDFNQASDTLKDAIFLLNSTEAFVQQYPLLMPDQGFPYDRCAISKVLNQANLRAANPEVGTTKRDSRKRSRAYNGGGILIHAVYNTTSLSSAAFGHCANPFFPSLTAVRIEEADDSYFSFDDDDICVVSHDGRAHLLAAILLYNAAVTSLCKHRVRRSALADEDKAGKNHSPVGFRADQDFKLAVGLLSLSLTALSVLMIDRDRQVAATATAIIPEQQNDPFLIPRVTLIQAISLKLQHQLWIQVFGGSLLQEQPEAASAQLRQQAVSCAATLAYLQDVADSLTRLETFQATWSSPAA